MAVIKQLLYLKASTGLALMTTPGSYKFFSADSQRILQLCPRLKITPESLSPGAEADSSDRTTSQLGTEPGQLNVVSQVESDIREYLADEFS